LEEPEKPFSGRFIVRINPELHREINTQAKLSNQSINHWVSKALEKAIAEQRASYEADQG